MRLSEAIDTLCIATRANGRSSRTVQSYREKLRHLVAFLGDVDVEGITVHDLRRWVADMRNRSTIYGDHPTRQKQARELSPFTINTRVKAMRRLFHWLKIEGLLEADPSERIDARRPKRKAPKGISEADIVALLAACGDDPTGRRDRAAILFLLDSGCRAGGLCGLRADELDLEGGMARVCEKGQKERHVMFTQSTRRALAAWLEVKPKGEHVFMRLKGKGALTPNGLWQALNRRAKQAGVEGPVSIHDFRHTFARQYLLDGGDLGTLAQILGHSDVRITVEYYSIYTVGELKQKHRQHSPVAKLFGGEYNVSDN
jgi:site-specific recombinase XerD